MEILNFVFGYFEDTLRSFKLQILRSYAIAHMLSVSVMWFLLRLFLNCSKNLDIKSSYLFSEALSRYSQELWFLPPIMTAQNFVVSEIWLFYGFFFQKKSFRKLKLNFFLQNLKFPTL